MKLFLPVFFLSLLKIQIQLKGCVAYAGLYEAADEEEAARECLPRHTPTQR
jgi:hypothetical protein